MLQIYKACQLFLNKNGKKLEQKKQKEKPEHLVSFLQDTLSIDCKPMYKDIHDYTRDLYAHL